MMTCLKWCWISVPLLGASNCPFGEMLMLCVWLEGLLVQHHSQCFIQFGNVTLKQECAVCFLIPRNIITLWHCPASFSVTFCSTLISVWVAVPIISISLQTQCTWGFYPQADWLSMNSTIPTSSPRASCTESPNNLSIKEESIWN